MSQTPGGRSRQTPPRDRAVSIHPGDRVAVTGAAGFIGSAITRRLLERGASVVAVAEPAGDRRNLHGLDVEVQPADVRDRESLGRALSGCRFVFHAAALYGFWAKDPALFYAVNVEGTRNVLDAASAGGVERLVYTSTVGTLGLDGPVGGSPATEESFADLSHLFGHYKRSKYVAEHEVLRAAAQGAPVTMVLPTFPLGPRDRRPTPTGKVVVDFLNGRFPGYVDTAMNVAHVDDLATGHLLALERGRVGRSYIVGGQNLSMRELLSTLAEVTGLPPVTVRFPRILALVAGFTSETVQGRILGRSPSVPLEAARMSATSMIFDDSRAREELGYVSRPARAAVEDSARWFVENGYVVPARRAMLALA
ncbi:MAG TPA: hopanoid-associated sugar epimerase [Acidimicrobiales bacterium]|nr:hopanoid-associated sugar epimerase [Acidimicrobiales bacterium]